MKRAIDETERRRAKQMEHNEKHGIVPKSVKRSIADILDASPIPGKGGAGRVKIAEPEAKYTALTPQAAMKQIKKMEKQMYKHAQDLEFEEASNLRDKIAALRKQALELPIALENK